MEGKTTTLGERPEMAGTTRTWPRQMADGHPVAAPAKVSSHPPKRRPGSGHQLKVATDSFSASRLVLRAPLAREHSQLKVCAQKQATAGT